MLKPYRDILPADNAVAPATQVGPVSLPRLLRILRHQYRLVLAVTALFVAGAIVYSLTAPRIFKASASLLIDVRQDDPLRKDQRNSDAQADTAAIESQVQLMTSAAVAAEVVRKMRLTEDPEFVGDDSWLPSRLFRWAADAVFGGAAEGPATEKELEQATINRLVDSIKVSRVGRTYIVEVTALSRDSVKAADIANAIAKAYTDDQFNARFASAERSAEWLKKRAAELRQQSLDADRAVHTFTSRPDRERVELKSLETTAQTYRTLFENYLNQYTTTVQQQSFPISFARVVTPATPPKRKSYPRVSLLLLGSLVGGLGLGWLAGFARESVHRTLRSEQDIQDATRLQAIGTLPDIACHRRGLLAGKRSGDMLNRPPLPGAGAGLVLVGRSSALMQIVRLYPRSVFAETIKSIKAAIALEDKATIRIVGITSAQPGEGKTVVAANLGQHLASTGSRTILLDWNFQNPTLTEATPPAAPGGPDRAERTISTDAASGLAFQPVSDARRGGSLADILTAPSFRAELKRLADRYDFIVVDLPCLDTVIEARAVASLVDGCVVVCSAKNLLANELTRSVERWTEAGLAPLIGFVLNRTPVRRGKERLPQVSRPPSAAPEVLTVVKAA